MSVFLLVFCLFLVCFLINKILDEFFFDRLTDGFGKTSKFFSFLYYTYKEREREERRVFIFKRAFVKEILLALSLLFFFFFC